MPLFLLALYIPDQRCASLVSLSARCVPYRCSDLGEGDEQYNKTLIDRVYYTSDASALCYSISKLKYESVHIDFETFHFGKVH